MMMRNQFQKKPQPNEPSGGIRGSVRNKLYIQMLDAVPGPFKILICDGLATHILNSCFRMHDLMDHGVTLLEDLQTARQPIISSPALYFFAPNDASVKRIIQDWETKDFYKEVHIFALGSTADRFVHQLAQTGMASKILSFKDMLLDFSAPETLLFHLNMQNEMSQLLSSRIGTGRSAAMEIAASRLASVFHTLNSGVPIIRYQNRSQICPAFAKLFLEKLARLCHDAPEFKNGGGGESPVLVIVDRSFDTVAPLIHERTYQCLLDDLMPLENNMYEQTFNDRTGNDSKRQCFLDEEDFYWCQYRHRFFPNCLEEIPAALKKLHQDHPTLAQGMTHNRGNVNDLGSAVRALPVFKEKQSKLSLHIDICSKIMFIYRERHLAEICEVEQDIAASRKPFKINLENVRRLTRDASVPQRERLRLILLLCAASDTMDFTEAKKQQLLQESGLLSDAHRVSNLELMTTRIGRLRRENNMSEPDRVGCPNMTPPDTPFAFEDPFVNQAYLIMEAVSKNALSTVDFPFMNSPFEVTPGAAFGAPDQDGIDAIKKTLRVSLALASIKRPDAIDTNNISSSGGGPPVTATRSAKGCGSLDLGHEGGLVQLNSSQRIVFFVLGGVTYGESRAAYQAANKLGREVIVGGTSILRSEAFVRELCDV